MTRGGVAKKVRENKEKHPELYCPNPKCLWRTGGGPCPRHAPAKPPVCEECGEELTPFLGEENGKVVSGLSCDMCGWTWDDKK